MGSRSETRDRVLIKKIRIALADDHPIFRDGLRLLLDLEPDFEVVAEAEDGADVIDLLKKHQPDILLLDLMMPRLDGLSVLQRIASRNLKTKSIILTVAEDQKAYVLAMRYGASGIVVKNKASEFLVEGIRRVQNGEICVDDKTMVVLMEQFSTPQRPSPSLSDREKEVASLVCQGLPNKEIADRLFVCTETVKSHLHHIFEKTGVSDRIHLVLYAVEFNLPLKSGHSPAP